MNPRLVTPILIVVLVALGGCAATDPASTTSTSPSATTSETAAATPSPTASASAKPELQGLRPDTVASVVTTELVVRTLPEVSDASEILPRWLNEPTLLYVVDGPVAADGYDWYQVQPFGMHYLDFMLGGTPPFGWVAAAGKDGEEWIAPASLECPGTDLDAIRSMTDIGRFACFGGEELTLEGQFGGCFVADPTVITPEWLFQTGCSLVPPGYQAGQVLPDPGGLRMRVAPGLEMPSFSEDAVVRVVGHFDDPDARTCEPVEAAIEPMEPAAAVLLCRAQFVVTHIEEIVG